MSEPVFTVSGLDALPPPKVARKAEAVGIAKAVMHPLDVFVLAVLAVANMYFIPVGLLVRDEVDTTGIADENLSWRGFLLDNLLPVTLGNVVGGAVLVGAVYWLVYLRGSRGRGQEG